MTINYSWIKVLDDKNELQDGRAMTVNAGKKEYMSNAL